MAQIGLDTVYVGIRGDGGKVVADSENGLSETGVYEVDTNKKNGNLGSKTANITNLSGTPVKISGNDVVVDVDVPTAAPSIAWDSNLINYIVKQKLLGRISDGKGGFTDGDQSTECGVIIVTHSPITMKKMYYAFGRGIFNESAANTQTNTDTAKTREDDNLTFTALTCPEFNNKMFKVYYADDEKFTEAQMFSEVFPGQTFVQAVPAPTDSTADKS